ncbi:hypothetical protein M885DRAFT_504628 [Pelagophyceae sp. CCMP2097]|nr:hypothetical protein M885DRAFT_504628 [Pelagophyceae sp. CCMP2097]
MLWRGAVLATSAAYCVAGFSAPQRRGGLSAAAPRALRAAPAGVRDASRADAPLARAGATLDADELVQRVVSSSFTSPSSGRRRVAWRRLAAALGEPHDRVRRRYLDEVAARRGGPGGDETDVGGDVLPLIEPWEYQNLDPDVSSGGIRGVVAGRAVSLYPIIDGDACLSHGVYEDEGGVTYEVGSASEKQLAFWASLQNQVAAPSPLFQLGTNPLNIGAAVLAAPLVAASAAVAIGVLTHHLQIEVFVI